MAIKIRLSRFGKKKKPHYRIVAVDGRRSRDGEYLENLGLYTPYGDKPELWIDLEKVESWRSKGAQCTETVSRLISRFKKMKEKGELPSSKAVE